MAGQNDTTPAVPMDGGREAIRKEVAGIFNRHLNPIDADATVIDEVVDGPIMRLAAALAALTPSSADAGAGLREALEHIRTCRAKYAASGFPIGIHPDAAGYMERYAEAALAAIPEGAGSVEPGSVADIGVYGPIDGTGRRDPSGSYFRVVLTKNDTLTAYKISIGAAEVLAAELAGLLDGAALSAPPAQAETTGQKIIGGLRQAVAHAGGDTSACRETVVTVQAQAETAGEDARVTAAMDAFYPGENWRVDLGCALDSSLRDMQAAIAAADAAGPMLAEMASEIERLAHALEVSQGERDAAFKSHTYWAGEAARSAHALAEIRSQLDELKPPAQAETAGDDETAQDRIGRLRWQLRQHGNVDTDDLEWLVEEAAHRHAAQAGAGDGWLPIETAPKDGRTVLLYSDQWVNETVLPGFCNAGTWLSSSMNISADQPTHWRPLPAAPIGTGNGEDA